MNLNLIVIETHPRDGVNSYQEKQFGLTDDDSVAVLFVREFADTWRPNARHDHENDIFSASEGRPQWTLVQCALITHLTVPVVGQSSSARVALVSECRVIQ